MKSSEPDILKKVSSKPRKKRRRARSSRPASGSGSSAGAKAASKSRASSPAASAIGWAHPDISSRELARSLLAEMADKRYANELGFGLARDALSEILFPGTSTQQTRLKYMLFVPWIYQIAESKAGSLGQAVKKLELALIDVLDATGETGVIGKEARASTKKTACDTYWTGLGAWRIRLFKGGREYYHLHARDLARRRSPSSRSGSRLDDPDLEEAGRHLSWNPRLPKSPSDFPKNATFNLTRVEAKFILDQLSSAVPKSLLAHLAENRLGADCDFAWSHPALKAFPGDLREILENAEIFSGLAHLATIAFYRELNLLVKDEKNLARCEREFERARMALDAQRLKGWDHGALWETLVKTTGHVDFYNSLYIFIESWRKMVLSGRSPLDNPKAHELIRDREIAVKLHCAKFKRPDLLQKWSAPRNLYQMDFRWSIAKGFLSELLQGLKMNR